jgi:hypothetical protein
MASEADEKRKSEEDRRSSDRRSGDDSEFEGEDQREGDRRSEEDRRAGIERRAKERKNLAKIAIYGIGGCAIPILILILLTQIQEPVRRKSGARKLEVDTLLADLPTRVAPEKAKPAPPKKTPVESLRDDLLGLAPYLYHGVKLESLISKTDPAAIDSTASVEAIEFQVKGAKWDTMGGTDKVVVLNKTFSYLKKRFPYLTRTVRLIFDDGRPDLDLQFE